MAARRLRSPEQRAADLIPRAASSYADARVARTRHVSWFRSCVQCFAKRVFPHVVFDGS
jgi:hypothetical protein